MLSKAHAFPRGRLPGCSRGPPDHPKDHQVCLKDFPPSSFSTGRMRVRKIDKKG